MTRTYVCDFEDWEKAKDLVDEAIKNRYGEASLATNTELDQNKEDNIECIPLSNSLKVFIIQRQIRVEREILLKNNRRSAKTDTNKPILEQE